MPKDDRKTMRRPKLTILPPKKPIIGPYRFENFFVKYLVDTRLCSFFPNLKAFFLSLFGNAVVSKMGFFE